MIVIEERGAIASPSRSPKPHSLPPAARRAARAAQAISLGRLTPDQAGALYGIDIPTLETWVRALSVAGLARPAAAEAI